MMIRIAILLLLIASPAWADVSIDKEGGEWWYSTDYVNVTPVFPAGGYAYDWGLDGTPWDDGTHPFNIHNPTYYTTTTGDTRTHAADANTPQGTQMALGVNRSYPKVMLAPGDNYLQLYAQCGVDWQISYPNPPGTYYGAGFDTANSCGGLLRYQNVNGGWTKIVLKCNAFNDKAVVCTRIPSHCWSWFHFNYRVYTNPGDPLGSTVNTAGRLTREWEWNGSGSGTKDWGFVRHNIYGTMAPEAGSGTWADPVNNWQSGLDYAVIYVPNNAYFYIETMCATDVSTPGEFGTVNNLTKREPRASMYIDSIVPVNANQVPTEWGGTTGNKPSPNTSIP